MAHYRKKMKILQIGQKNVNNTITKIHGNPQICQFSAASVRKVKFLSKEKLIWSRRMCMPNFGSLSLPIQSGRETRTQDFQ